MPARIILVLLLAWNAVAYASVEIPASIISASKDVNENASVETAIYPAYPEEALEAGVDGKVTLAFIINEIGRASDVQVLAAQPAGVFEETAEAALLFWSFDSASSESIECGSARQGAVITFHFNHAGQPTNTSFSGLGVVKNPDPDPKEKHEARRKFDRELEPIRRIEPRYPRASLIRGVEGMVALEFTVTSEGNVDDIKIVQSVPKQGFTRSALKAISGWEFKPAIIDGKSVPRKACQTFIFKLSYEDQIKKLPGTTN